MSLPSRSRPTRSAVRTRFNSAQRSVQKPTEIFPGLNDITDALEALPSDIIRYFTLLKEIDAKCVSLIPILISKIIKFKEIEDKPELKEIRTRRIQEISQLIRTILPSLEEKMHVAGIVADKTTSYISRINDDFELIFKNEIPESVKFGPTNHPAIINNTKIPENKSVQSQRSETRREALAAKKAANDAENEDSKVTSGTRGPKSRKEREGTPTGGTSSVPPQQQQQEQQQQQQPKKRKQASTTPNSNNNNSIALKPTLSNNSSTTTPVTQSNSTQSNSGLVSNNLISQALKNEEVHITRPSTPSGTKRSRQSNKKKVESQSYEESHSLEESNQKRNSNDEPLYCYCNQVSYGEMVGCDGDDCKREWFHLPCTGLATLPKGKWYCDDCNAKLKKARKI